MSLDNDPAFKTNCHGTTFCDGAAWLNDPSVILDDEYSELAKGENPPVGAIGVYWYKELPDHSVTVTRVSKKTGKVITVEGLGGLEPKKKRQSPDCAWKRGKLKWYIKKIRRPKDTGIG